MSQDEWPLKAVQEEEGQALSSTEINKVQQTVADLLGPDQKIVGVEKKVIVKEEEVIMVNGTPIALEGQEGQAIKDCLLKGTIPNQDLLNHLLAKAGLIVVPGKAVKSCLNLTQATTTHESAFLHDANGQVLDHRMAQAKDISRHFTSRQDQVDFVHPKVERIANKSSKAVLTSVPNVKSGLVYDDTDMILSGSLDELIHEFVPRAHFVAGENYQFSFLLASRLFVTPNRLLGEIYRRADQLAHMLSHESHPSFALNMVQMLSHWMVWFPSDFRDESMLSKVRQLVKLIIEWHSGCETKLNQLMQTLTGHLSAIDRHEKYLEKLKAAENHTSCQHSINDFLDTYSATIFAQELTRIELEHLCFLGPEELVHAFAKESSSKSQGKL